MASGEDRELLARRILAETSPNTDLARTALARRILEETEPSLGETVAGYGKLAVGGVLQAAGEGVRGVGQLADSMRSLPGMGFRMGDGGPSELIGAGEWISDLAPEADPRVAGTLGGNIASGVGQVAGLIGAGAANPMLAAEMAFFGGVSDTERDLTMQDPDTAGEHLGAMLLGGAVNTADMIPVNRILGRISKLSGGVPSAVGANLRALQELAADAPTVARMGGQVAITTMMEAGTEGLQRATQNAIVDFATDQELDLLRGVADESAAGGGVGFLLSAIVEGATRKRRAIVAEAARREIPWEQARSMYREDAEFRAAVDFAAENEQIMEGALAGREPVAPVAATAPNADAPATVVLAPESGVLVEDVPQADAVVAGVPASPETVRAVDEVAEGVDYRTPQDEPSFTGSNPVIVEEAKIPAPDLAQRVPAPGVLGAPSIQATAIVPGQFDPTGKPAVLITGSRPGMAWGGSRENTVGTRAPIALDDVARPLLDYVRSRGVSTLRRTKGLDKILGSYDAGGRLDAGYGDVQTLAHEVGHQIHRDLMAGQRSTSQVATNPAAVLDQLPPVVQGEIRTLAYAGAAPGRELSEGFAELFRMWLLMPETVRARAPQSSRWLESWVVSQPKEVSQPILQAQDNANSYRFQGDEMRAQVKPPPSFLDRAENYMRGLPLRLYERIFDDAHVLRQISPKLHEMWTAIRGTSRGMVTNWVSEQPTDLAGNAIPGQRNFNKAIAPLRAGEQTLFDEYLLARRTLALEGRGVDTSKAPAEARRLVDKLDATHPHFAQVAENLSEWWAGVNQVLAQASPTYAAQMARIAADDAAYGVDFYAPLHRWLQSDSGQSWLGGSARRRALTNPVSRRQDGSTLPVKSPLEAFVNEARGRFEQAVYRNLVESLVGAYDAAQGTVQNLMFEITADDPGAQALVSEPAGSLEGMLTALAAPEVQGDMMAVKILDASGRVRFFRLDARLAKLAAEVDPGTLRTGLGFFGQLAMASRRAISTGQIVLNPGFQYVGNLMLDIPQSYLASQYFKVHELPVLVGYTARNVLQNAIGTYKPLRGPWQQMYERLGLHGTAGLAGEARIGRTVRAQIAVGARGPTPRGAVRALRTGWDALTAFMSIPQRGVQLAHMQKAAKAHKIDIMQPITADEANILRRAARLGVDYNAGGDLSRKWQLFIPFLRPSLDASRQMGSAALANPIQFFAKIGTLSAMAGAMRYLLADREFEREKSAVDQMRSVTIPFEFDGQREGLEFRIPGEIAWLTILPWALWDSMANNGEDPGELILAAAQSALPPTPLGMPIVDQIRRQFGGGNLGVPPVVPLRLEGREPLAQQTPLTAPAAIGAATLVDTALASAGLKPTSPIRQLFGSPIRWESAIRAQLGSNGLSMVEGWGFIPGLRTGVEPEGADLLNGVLRRNGMSNWNDRNIRSIYELNLLATQKHATLNGQFEDPRDRMTREYLGATAATLSIMRYLSTYESEGLTLSGRRALATAANKLARESVEAIKAGKLPTAYMKYEAEYGIRKDIEAIQRGAIW